MPHGYYIVLRGWKHIFQLDEDRISLIAPGMHPVRDSNADIHVGLLAFWYSYFQLQAPFRSACGNFPGRSWWTFLISC